MSTLRGLCWIVGTALLLGCGDSPAPTVDTANAAEPRRAAPSLIARTTAKTEPLTGWPQFRGTAGMGVTSAQLPVEWSHTDHMVWKTPLPGAGASSPIVFGNQIYLTAYTGYLVPGEDRGEHTNLQRHLIAISRKDGKIVWDKAVAAVLPEEENIRDHGFAASTPAADADRVYTFFGKTGVLAFDHQGKTLWQTSVGTKTHGWGSSASPILFEELVIVNASVESESLVALDRHTGKEVWRAGGIKEAWNTPLIIDAGGHPELIVATHGKILAFHPLTGKPLWNCDTDITWYMAPSMVAHDGVVYALGGRSGITALAVRAGGQGDVTRSHRLWTIKDGSNVSSPVWNNGYLYFANDNRETAYCIDTKSGEVVYQQRLERAGQIYASALLAADRVYYTTRQGKTFVLSAKPGFEQLSVNSLEDRSIFNASPAVDGNRLLIRSDKYLYCLGQ